MASPTQSSAGPGATDMSRHVQQVAQQCPDTIFVVGGYSQGASVTFIAIGVRTMLGRGESIPEALAPRIAAVVTFGNPLRLSGRTIQQSSPLYGAKSIEVCNRGDPVCGGGFNTMAHVMYASDGSAARAAQEAVQLVLAARGGGAAAPAPGVVGPNPNVQGVATNAGGRSFGFPGFGRGKAGGSSRPSFGV